MAEGGEEVLPERVRYLVGSAERVEILEALAQGVTRQCNIGRRCSIARSTVHRNLDGCQQRGWVRETDDGYALTTTGRHVLAAYREFARAVDTLTEHAPVLERLDLEDDHLGVDALAGCETTVATRENPHAPSIAAGELIERNAGDRVRILVSGVSPITNDAGWTALSAGSELETVVDHDVFRTLEESYADTVERALDDEAFSLHVCPPPIEAGVVLAGSEVCVLVDGEGGAHACLTGSTPELRGWAEATYETALASATEVETLGDAAAAEAEAEALER
jgi:predicted transcriptional regulator